MLRPRAPVTRRQAAFAVALLGVCVCSWLAAPVSGTAQWRPPDAIGLVLTALAVLPVAARLALPLPALGLAGPAALGLVFGGYGFTLGSFVVWGLLGSTALHTDARTTRALTVVGAVSVAASVATFSPDDRQVLGLIVAAGVGMIPCFVGDALRRQRELLAEVHRLQRAELQQVRDAERLRIARDVHDSVGHHLSAISLQAEAGQLTGETEALRTIAALSRRAVADTGQILGMLNGEALPAPVPRLSDLPQLVATAGLAGVEVELEHVAPTEDLPDLVSTCGYRIVQEALTNTARHAAPARARLRIDRTPASVRIAVADDGAPAPLGSGHGLTGMRERVEAVGGALAVGPRAGGGWLVEAELPCRAS